MKSINIELLNELFDYVENNTKEVNLIDKGYLQAIKDLRVFLRNSDTENDVKRFLKKKELEK